MGKRTARQRALSLPDVLRLMGCFVLMYTSRVVCKGRLTMEEIIFSLKGRGARPHSKMSQQLARG
jgi:hypothetical protein